MRATLEDKAACLLGHLLFGLSRLELNLGLCLVHLCGKDVSQQTERVEKLSLNEKLEELSRHVRVRLISSKHQIAFEAWLKRACTIRLQRNEFVHGRWGVEVSKDKVVNVIGLPSPNQKSVDFDLAELEAIKDEVSSLEKEFSRLRKECGW